MRNAEKRDNTRDRYPNSDVICFEMEAAGVQDETKCLVIRGIADYADSHHNHVWQNFAAMQAAAFACELLYKIQPSEVEEIRNEVHGTLRVLFARQPSIENFHRHDITQSKSNNEPTYGHPLVGGRWGISC